VTGNCTTVRDWSGCALADDRPEVRFQAVVAVCRISKDQDEIADVLTSGMKDPDPEVRTIAVRAREAQPALGLVGADADHVLPLHDGVREALLFLALLLRPDGDHLA
jgi:hypothetical protein